MSGNDALRTSIQCSMISAMLGQLRAAYRGDQKAIAEGQAEEAFYRTKLREIDNTRVVKKFAGETVELRAGSTDGKVAGWASTPDLDLYGHRVQNGAFSESIRKRGLIGPTAVKLLLDHDRAKPAGVITTLEYRSKGLWIEADLDLSVSYVADRYSIMKKLQGFNFSVGFYLEEYKEERDGLRITKGDLFEVSLVAFPGNEAATASVKGRPSLQDALDRLRALNQSIR